MKITFKKIGINGEGIGYYKHKPVFCDGVLPEEIADINIEKEFGSYYVGKLNKLIKKSPKRIKNHLSQEEECEGCVLSLVDYETQLLFKDQLIKEALWKYAKVKPHWVREFKPSPNVTGYRNACKLPFGTYKNRLVNGMYKPNSNHFVTIETFTTHTTQLETIRKKVLKILNKHHLSSYDAKTKKGLRYLILRSLDNKHQLTLVTGKEEIAKEVVEELYDIEGMYTIAQSVNTDKHTPNQFGKKVDILMGQEYMPISMHGLNLKLNPQSFFQLNYSQAQNIYDMAVSKIDACDTLVEAYCGIGTMSLMAKDKAKHIIGIEYVKEAIDNAKDNALANNITNVEFRCNDASVELKKISKKKDIDCLLVDPPRSGLDQDMLETILSSHIKRIIYVSCNPSTLAKNIKVLKKYYEVNTIIPYDMFPMTPHIESITVLTRTK